MPFASDTLLILRCQLRLAWRNPVWLAFGLVQPILYLILFGPLFAKIFNRNVTGHAPNAYAFFIGGLLIQLSLFGTAFVGFRLIADWRYGIVDRLRVSPVSRLAILGGRVLRDAITLLIQAVVLIIASIPFGLRAPIGGVLIGLSFVSVVAVSVSAISYSAGLLLKNEDILSPVINMIVFPITLLSGIMLPLNLGPGWLQGIARAVPFRYVVDAIREDFAGHYLNMITAEGAAVAMGFACLSLWLGTYVFIRENA